MPPFWVDQGPGRLGWLTGALPGEVPLALPEAVALTLDALPEAPAVITCRPPSSPTATAIAAALLDELTMAAVALYPAWLPEASTLDDPGGAATAAVRALARNRAGTSDHFGPFLAALAERALRDRAAARAATDRPSTGRIAGNPPAAARPRKPGPRERFTPAVRATGLARVLADSYQRRYVALLIRPPEPATDTGSTGGAGIQALLSACEWLAGSGGFAVWLTGPYPPEAGHVPRLAVSLPEPWSEPTTDTAGETRVRVPALAGQPHPASATEQSLEEALSRQPWAAGRAWNQPVPLGPLIPPVRVDLLWNDARLVVEVDGPEHAHPGRYEADRRRDARLQLAGFAVLRVTNAQVQDDLAATLATIEQLLRMRRERNDHVR